MNKIPKRLFIDFMSAMAKAAADEADDPVGRSLRKAEGKKGAIVYVLFVAETLEDPKVDWNETVMELGIKASLLF